MNIRPLLQADQPCAEFPAEDGVYIAVGDLGFTVTPGETLAIVGESGSRKSVILRVSLSVEHLSRFPHEFSGGQRQLLVHRPCARPLAEADRGG